MSAVDRRFVEYPISYVQFTLRPLDSRVSRYDAQRFLRQMAPPTVDHALTEVVDAWGDELYPSSQRHATLEREVSQVVFEASISGVQPEPIADFSHQKPRRSHEVRGHRGPGFLANVFRRRKPQ